MFDKAIPVELVSSNLYLIFLSVANNSINGSIPTCICSADTIQVLDFRLNNLSGSIPPCIVENMSSLQVPNLFGNNISGEIPDKFSTNCGLRFFYLSNNNLGGNRNCKSLVIMNVRHNMIEGSLPCMLSSKLRVLIVGFNKLAGEVKCSKSWRDLQIMDAPSNNLSGDLHRISFSSWKNMVMIDREHIMGRRDKLDLNDFYYRAGGFEMETLSIMTDFSLVDLSSNNFTGEIPDAIGDLRSLCLLNLSHNAHTGVIPKSFGSMENLEALDLSVNHLTGAIPQDLTRLVFLSQFNKLVGEIPSVGQFSTFENDSYLGNDDLCGFPLLKRCNVVSSSESSHILLHLHTLLS